MRRLVVLAVALWFALSCATSLENASAKYKADKDAQSLHRVAAHLRRGMPREEVERLLGPPGYAPTDGQYYYESSRRNHVLVVDYREGDRRTDRLQRFDFETLGE